MPCGIGAAIASRRPRPHVGHFRLVFRDIARSSDERTLIARLRRPAWCSATPPTPNARRSTRPNSAALLLCALLNSFPMDWAVRQKAAAHLSLFIVQGLPDAGPVRVPPNAWWRTVRCV